MSSETSSAAAIGDVEGVSLYDVDNPAPVIEPPRKRTSKAPKASRGNFEHVACACACRASVLPSTRASATC
ncbi:succinate dehydrogenase [Streptomyces badius]